MAHKQLISDHKPILVTILNRDIVNRNKPERDKILDKQHLKKISMEMVQDIIDSPDLCSVLLAFELRLNKIRKWIPIKPNKMERILEKMDNDFEE